jgi:hypothetical protein
MRPLFLLFLALASYSVFAQSSNFWKESRLTGSVETNNQYYLTNNRGNIVAPQKRFASNTYATLTYQYKNFTAGIQLEGYHPALQGFPSRYQGNKLARRFIRYTNKWFELQVGNFYEQFGNGLIFRAFEERSLGLDNNIDGVSVRLTPIQSVKLKLMGGRPRYFMLHSPAEIMGGDLEWTMLNKEISGKTMLLKLGGSYIKRFMRYYGADPKFPQKVQAIAARVNGQFQNFSWAGEWVGKSIEANFQNDYIKKKGSILFLKAGWQDPSNKLGGQLQFRRLENADFKGNFNSSDAVASINYTPALTRQHTLLLATIYPHTVQPIGEIGGMADFFIRFKKNTPLGGKFGTKIDLNYSRYHALDSTRVQGPIGFVSNSLFGFGKTKLFRDFNLSVDKRWSTSYKSVVSLLSLFYNRTILQGGPYGKVHAFLLGTDHFFKIKKKQQLRINTEHMWVNSDEHNWAGILTEWSLPSGWTFFTSDMYNYQSAKMHYYNLGAAVSLNRQRLQVSIGQQRAGLICVGGICRYVPSYKGFSLNYTLNF